MGPQLTVLIIEVSLFQSVHNSRFDCIILKRKKCIYKSSPWLHKDTQSIIHDTLRQLQDDHNKLRLYTKLHVVNQSLQFCMRYMYFRLAIFLTMTSPTLWHSSWPIHNF